MNALLLHKYFILPLLCAVAIINAAAQQNTVTQNQYRKTGPAYFADLGDKQGILFMGKSAAAYAICLYDAKNGELLRQKEIVATNISPDQVIGTMGDILWIYIDSLVGYNVQSLEPVATETAIAAKNGFMQNNFSKYTNSYLLDEAAQVLYISADDGERYKLYADLSMKPDDTASDPPAEEDFNYEFAAEYKLNDRYQLKYALANVDTFKQHLYVLGSENETGQVLDYFGSSIFTEREETRKLTIIGFNSNGDKIDYDQNKPFVSTWQYFKAGFLQRKFFATAWHGAAGEKIILHEKDKKLSAAIIDAAGNEKWTVDTNQYFNNFADYLINGKYLVIWFTGKDGTRFISLDLADGSFEH